MLLISMHSKSPFWCYDINTYKIVNSKNLIPAFQPLNYFVSFNSFNCSVTVLFQYNKPQNMFWFTCKHPSVELDKDNVLLVVTDVKYLYSVIMKQNFRSSRLYVPLKMNVKCK